MSQTFKVKGSMVKVTS